jgi:DNA (cytosine-5)-methyltransferase 1
MNKLKVFEMFAGYGGASIGLKKAGIDHEVVGFSEIDKHATKVWQQTHGETVRNFGDCTKINVDEVPDHDLLTGGFPCQAFSVAGKGQGVDDEKGRGLLFNDIVRIAEIKKPQYMLLENVKGLLSEKHKAFFEFTKSELARIGYSVSVQVYKSSDYGMPQMRERVFYVCERVCAADFTYTGPEVTGMLFNTSDFIEILPRDSKYFRSEKFVKWWKGRQKENGGNGFSKRVNDYFDKALPTITASMSFFDNHMIEQNGWYRHMSPDEAQKFQGLFDGDIDWGDTSNSQKYRMIGNGWDVHLVSKIFSSWFKFCDDCGNIGATDGICPYAQDIHEEEIECCLCVNCYSDRAGDI